MRTVIEEVRDHVQYLRGRFDAMTAFPVPAPEPARATGKKRAIAINLGIGGVGLVALIDLLKDFIR